MYRIEEASSTTNLPTEKYELTSWIPSNAVISTPSSSTSQRDSETVCFRRGFVMAYRQPRLPRLVHGCIHRDEFPSLIYDAATCCDVNEPDCRLSALSIYTSCVWPDRTTSPLQPPPTVRRQELVILACWPPRFAVRRRIASSYRPRFLE